GDQAVLSSGPLCRRELGEQFFLKALATHGLSPLPTTSVRDDLVVLVIDGDAGGVSFDGEMVADVARRHTVTIAGEAEAKIVVNQGFGTIAVVGRDCRHSSQSFWLKAFLRGLVGFTMSALIGHFFEPPACLQIDVG